MKLEEEFFIGRVWTLVESFPDLFSQKGEKIAKTKEIVKKVGAMHCGGINLNLNSELS